eukprot:TRINITY_DN3158_c0_g1_i1.p1 TRINITY_DN3158_c0_g1~~TRINITY_DN3158_c0_g1_i1.p1  ORF type:complete len:2591 (+),score=756.41 TRINITY_DN3158_c0_g1_i1:1154-7774(+)
MEAKGKGFMPTQATRGCIDPVFRLSDAREKHRQLMKERNRILNTYFLSCIAPGDDELPQNGFPLKEEKLILIKAIAQLTDMLREPTAYAKRLLASAKSARTSLDELTEKEEVLVAHSKDLVDTPEALSSQASYIKIKHQMQEGALDEFIRLMEIEHVQRFYATLRITLLQQLVVHRAYAIEAVSDWPNALLGGSGLGFNENVLNAADQVINADRTGVRLSAVLLDEASHIIPRWLAERYEEQLMKLTHEGQHVFSDCCLARLLHSFPPPSEDDKKAFAFMGTGTLSAAAQERRAARAALPISTVTALQLSTVALENTLIGQRHVVLPTNEPQANWKEASLVTKCGIRNRGGKFTGAGIHHKPQKYGYAKGEAEETTGASPTSPMASRTLARSGKAPPARQGVVERGALLAKTAKPTDAMQIPPSQLFPVGCSVEAHGLNSLPELNGKTGTVAGYETEGDLAGRIQCVFPDPFGKQALKPTCLYRAVKLSELDVELELELRDGTHVLSTATDGEKLTVVPFGKDPKAAVVVEVEKIAYVLDKVVPKIGAPSPGKEPPGGNSFASRTPAPPKADKVQGISWSLSTLTCTPRMVAAGNSVNCVLVLKDAHNRKTKAEIMEHEIDVLPFGHKDVTVVTRPAVAAEDAATFHFTLELKCAETFPIGVAIGGKCFLSANVTVVAATVDWLGMSKLLVNPTVTIAGEPMYGRIELRDAMGNLATSAGLDDFTVSVTNIVELATTTLKQEDDGAFTFTFVPTEEGDVEVEIGFCGLLKQNMEYLECRSGQADYKNTLVVLDNCEAEVGDMAMGVVVLRDLYGNRASNVHDGDLSLKMRAGDNPLNVPLNSVAGEVAEYDMEFQCTRRGLMLLESASSKTKEVVVTKVTVAMPNAAIDWSKSTISLVPRDVVAGNTVTCTVLARDSYGNLLSNLDIDDVKLAIISDPLSEVETKHGPLMFRGGTLTCCFEPLQSGLVHVQVSSGAIQKPSNNVLVSAGPLSWEASTVTMRDEAKVGDTVAVNVTARDKYGNICPTAYAADFQVVVWNEDEKLDPSKMSPAEEKGDFVFSFEPERTGHAWVEVFYSNQSKESNRCVIAAGKACWSQSRVLLDRLEVKAGEVLRCDVTLLDKCGNVTANDGLTASDFMASICDADGNVLAANLANATPIDGVGSQFWFQFSPTQVGDLYASVAYEGEMNNSPNVTIHPEVICWERSKIEFDKEEFNAGAPVLGKVFPRDRFENASEVFRYTGGNGMLPTTVKESDIEVVCKNYAEADHEVLAAKMDRSDRYGVFVFQVVPKMMGAMSAFATMGDSTELTAKCTILGAGIDWSACSIILNPAEMVAGDEAVCIISVRDTFGNPASGASPQDFIAAIWNESATVRASEMVATGESTFRFTCEPTRAGMACATITYGEEPKESNTIYVKPGELEFSNSTLAWGVTTCYAGDHLEGTLTFRDRFGNPCPALPPNEIDVQVSNEGKSVKAFFVDDYVSSVETTQVRFYCEPTVRGAVECSATRIETSESIVGNRCAVKAGPVSWSDSTVEIPSMSYTDAQRTCISGETVTAIITCRDKYGNLANPGTPTAFGITIKSSGQLQVAPVPYVPKSPGGEGTATAADNASIFHFDIKPTVAGKTEVDVLYNPDPGEQPHHLDLDVKSGKIDWKSKCEVLAEERETVAGGTVNFTIVIKDAHGNSTGGAVGSMFITRLENEGTSYETTYVKKADDTPNTFNFSAKAAKAGDARASVAFNGHVLYSPVVRVIPDGVYFPKCKLEVPQGVRAGEQVTATLLLRDKNDNPCPLGELNCEDFIFNIANSGTPDGASSPQTRTLQPIKALGPVSTLAGLIGGRPTELCLTFEPILKGSLCLTVTCPPDPNKHKFKKDIPVDGGEPSLRHSGVTIKPANLKAGEKVTVTVIVKDCHRNTTKFDLKNFAVSAINERDAPKCTDLKDSHNGFSFSFEPTKYGAAKSKLTYKGIGGTSIGRGGLADSVDTEVVQVSAGPLCAEQSTAKLDPSSQKAGNPCTATLTLRDKYKNSLVATEEELENMIPQLNITIKNEFRKPEASAPRLKGTAMVLEFEAQAAGNACITVQLKDGKDDSTLKSNEISVVPGPVSFEHSSAVIDVESCAMQQPCSMILTTKDKFGNVTTGARPDHFSVDVVNEGEVIAQVKLTGKGKSANAFAAQIMPLKVGKCFCELTFYPPDGTPPVTKKTNTVSVTS